jgi:hypothetical protein
MMGMALELSVLGRSVIDSKTLNLKRYGQKSKLSGRFLPRAELHCPVALSSSKHSNLSFRFRRSCEFSYRSRFMLFSSSQCHEGSQRKSDSGEKELESIKVLLKRGIVIGALVCGVFLYGCQKVLASAGVVEAGYEVFGQSVVLFKNALPKIYQVLTVLREQGLILAALLSLSAFFSMAETSITTLWPWKVRELAEKEPENGVFRMLRSDVTRFLTTILIGTTVVNIAATALVTEAATAIFGEAGVSAATGLMTVAILLLTEITPKSVAVHNAQEVARIVVS